MVTAGLAESNVSLSPGEWLKGICGLTACTPGPTLGNDYGKTTFLGGADVITRSKFLALTETAHLQSSTVILPQIHCRDVARTFSVEITGKVKRHLSTLSFFAPYCKNKKLTD